MSTLQDYEEDVASRPFPTTFGMVEHTMDGQPVAACPVRPISRVYITGTSSYPVKNLAEILNEETAAEPGVSLSQEVLEQLREREALQQLAMRFATEGFAGIKVNGAAASAFAFFLRQLPPSLPLPRIGPDGDGGLTLHWSVGNREVLAVFEGSILHVIENPATSKAVYHRPVNIYNGLPIPLLYALKLK